MNLLAKYSLNRREKAVVDAIIGFLIISKNISIVTYKNEILHFSRAFPLQKRGASDMTTCAGSQMRCESHLPEAVSQ